MDGRFFLESCRVQTCHHVGTLNISLVLSVAKNISVVSTTSSFALANPLQTLPTEFCTALTTCHMQTSSSSLNHVFTVRTVFPTLLLAQRLHPLCILILRTQLSSMFPSAAMSTISSSAFTDPNITVDPRARHEGAAISE